MRYSFKAGTSGIATDDRDLMLHIARQHLAHPAGDSLWTIETRDPVEIVTLLEGRLQGQGLPAQPTKAGC